MELEKMKKQELIAEIERLNKKLDEANSGLMDAAKNAEVAFQSFAESYWRPYCGGRFICNNCRSSLSMVKTKKPFCPSCGSKMEL